MRRLSRAGLAALLVALYAPPASALYLDGGKLQGQCAAMSRDGSYRVADGLVGGYVAGVVDAALAARGKPGFCLPAATDLQRLREVACRYVGRHAEARRQGGAVLVRAALAEAYPCPR
jgi:hypothetical protein